MKQLSDRTAYMISNAAKTVGCSMEIYYYIEESLYIDEAQELYDFIVWLVNEYIPFTERTLPERFKQWKKGWNFENVLSTFSKDEQETIRRFR